MKDQTILFLGDTVSSAEMKQNLSTKVLEFLDSHDLVVVNLEGVFPPDNAEMTQRSVVHSGDLKDVFRPDKTLFFLGNNHIGDCGRDGLEATINRLEMDGFSWFGADGNWAFEHNDIEFFGLGWSLAGCPTDDSIGVLPLTRESDVVARLKTSSASLRVVCTHWGLEFERLPLPSHRQLAHRLVDAGADLIVGHHPHCVQARETYNSTPIYYSLGNFYFEQKEYNGLRVRYPLMSSSELAVSATICQNQIETRTHSLWFDRETHKLSFDKNQLAQKVLAQFRRVMASTPLQYEWAYRRHKDRKTLPTFTGRPGSWTYQTATALLKLRQTGVNLAIRSGLKRGYRERD